MTRIDLRAALDMLPRYDPYSRKTDHWMPDGWCLMTNNVLMPEIDKRRIVKLIRRTMRRQGPAKKMRMDVTGKNIRVFHRRLRTKSLMFLYRKNWKWNGPKWDSTNLPVMVRYKGTYVLWNGTHRMTLCRLARRKLLCWVIDFDESKEWFKTHYNDPCTSKERRSCRARKN